LLTLVQILVIAVQVPDPHQINIGLVYVLFLDEYTWLFSHKGFVTKSTHLRQAWESKI
jgi:hypothetical protein